MTFNTPDIQKMCCLIWKPFMSFKNIDLFPVGQQLEPVEISMAVKANAIIIKDGFLNIQTVPYINLIAMRVMAFPA
jgi:hypothetical protein